jgi:hypothetical protein
MRPVRFAVCVFAWLLPLAALSLLLAWTRRHHPGAVATVAALLSRKPAPPPGVGWLGRFGGDAETGRWRRDGAELAAENGWGRVTFRKGAGLPGIRLVDDIAGPAGLRDWSPYRRLAWEMRVPGAADGRLSLIVKDADDRRFERSFPLPARGAGRAAVDLAEMSPFIDLTRLGEIHFFMRNPGGEIVVELADIRLERDGPAGEVLGKPFVVFDRLEAPASARLGETISISAWLSVAAPQPIPYSVFLHLYPEAERGERIPARRAGYLHVENAPLPPVTSWPAGSPRQVGPFTVHLPKYNPAGRYLIRIGLYNDLSSGNGPREVPCRGAYDYAGSFPKCRYTDPRLDDFVVGSIEVMPGGDG